MSIEPAEKSGALSDQCRPLFVMGTMRSGTSMVCHLLTQSGFDFMGGGMGLPADAMNRPEHNPNGYYERRDVHYAYSALYQAYDHRPGSKARTVPLDLEHKIRVPDQSDEKAVLTFLSAMRNITADMRSRSTHWGLKCIHMAQNLGLIKRLEPRALVVYCFRCPDAVHKSMCLKGTEVSGYKVPLNYCKNHSLVFLRECQAHRSPVVWVSYDDFVAEPAVSYQALSAALAHFGLHMPRPLSGEQVCAMVNASFRHFQPSCTLSKWSHSKQQLWQFLRMALGQQAAHSFQLPERLAEMVKFQIVHDTNTLQKANDVCRCGSGLKFKKCCAT